MRRYVALIRKEARSDYGVEFPDFPGCVTAGSTLDEALSMAEEALEGHVEVTRDYGESIPEPRGLDAVLRDPDLAGAVAVLVPLREKKGRAVPVRITLDEHLLAEIDEAAARIGTTRSAFLALSARNDLAGFTHRAERSEKTEKPTQKSPSAAQPDARVYVGEIELVNFQSGATFVKKRDEKVTDIFTLPRFSSNSILGRAYVHYADGAPALTIDFEDDAGQTFTALHRSHSWCEIVEDFSGGELNPMKKNLIIAAIKRLDDRASFRKPRRRDRIKKSA